MKRIGHFGLWLLFVLNVVIVGGFFLAAFSPGINPVEHPLRACLGFTFPLFLVFVVSFLVFWLIVRARFALLSFVALLVCFHQIRIYIPFNFQSDEIPVHSIKLLSYNVMGFGDARKPKPDNEILAYIEDSRADIICLQEYFVGNNKNHLRQEDIDEALKDYPFRDIQKIGSGKSNTIACYSKYPILSARQVNYKSRTNGSVVYEIHIKSDTFTLINNHLESNKLSHEDRRVYEEMITDPETDKMKSGTIHLVKKLSEAMVIRAKQAEAIANEIKTSPHPYIVVCGDFNDTPISYTNKTISEALDNAFVQSGRGLGISYNRNKFFFRIDNILISKNLKSHHCTVDRTIVASDHYPIWCYISLNK